MSIVDRFSRRSARHGTLAIYTRVFRDGGSGRRGIYGISNDHGYVPSILTGVALIPSGGLAPPSRYGVQRPTPFHDQRLWSVAWIRRCSAATSSWIDRSISSARRSASHSLIWAQGYSASEAAEEMFLSPKTVEGYIGRAKTKLRLRNRRDIVRFALKSGMLRAEE